MADCDVLVYGPIAIDNIIRIPFLPTPEVDVIPTEDIYQIGAAAANTALWLATWQVRTRLCGHGIGHDYGGEIVWARLQEFPTLDISYLRRYHEHNTPMIRCLVTDDGERSFIVLRNLSTMPVQPLTAEILGGVKYLTLTFHADENPIAGAEVAHGMGVRAIAGDVVNPSHPTLPYLYAVSNSTAYVLERYPGADVRAHAHTLHDAFGGIVVTTNGGNLIHVVDRDGSAFQVQPPQVNVVDATGAGDSFTAGLVYGMLQGWALDRVVCWATAVGALKVQRIGAASNPATVAEVDALAATLHAEPVA